MKSKKLPMKIATERVSAMPCGDGTPFAALHVTLIERSLNSRSGCGSQALDQRYFVERFAEETKRSALERAVAVFVIWKGSNQNYWDATSLRSQCFLQLKPI
jgi:hypothetical protein